jgi:hypothetical protein
MFYVVDVLATNFDYLAPEYINAEGFGNFNPSSVGYIRFYKEEYTITFTQSDCPAGYGLVDEDGSLEIPYIFTGQFIPENIYYPQFATENAVRVAADNINEIYRIKNFEPRQTSDAYIVDVYSKPVYIMTTHDIGSVLPGIPFGIGYVVHDISTVSYPLGWENAIDSITVCEKYV